MKYRRRFLGMIGASLLAGAQAQTSTPAGFPTMDPRIVEGSCPPPWPEGFEHDGVWTVGMAFLVSAEGALLDARLLRSSGSRELDEASLAALKRCQFRAGVVGGKAVEAWTEVNKMYMRNLGHSRVEDMRRRERHD